MIIRLSFYIASIYFMQLRKQTSHDKPHFEKLDMVRYFNLASLIFSNKMLSNVLSQFYTWNWLKMN